MTALDWLGLALLGGVGAVVRFGVDGWFDRRFPTSFPFATLAINVSGSFGLGALTGAHAAAETIFLAGTGFIGSFTTFSTWIFESQRLAEDGEVAAGALNIAVTVAAGLAAGGAGWALGSVL